MRSIGDIARGIVVAGLTGEADAETARFAGCVVFDRNGATLEELRAFTDALRARAGDGAPLIAIDQEGGRVMRLRAGVEPMPPMMALGAADDPELAARAGEQVAFDLRRAGCTLDFAPVLDLAVEPANTAIGTRSFGADPQRVAVLGAAFARGLRAGGITPCFKHFPGHGATAVNSHRALPTIDASEATLRARELVPFAAVARDAPAMMSAHVVAAALDAEHPATVSRRIATELLRGELGFSGALFTDCLEMDAVAERGSLEAAVDAVVAGADAVLFSHDADLARRAAEAIEAAATSGRIAPERLEEAYARVGALRRGRSAPLPVDAPPPHPGVGREIARRAVTLVRGIAHADPTASIAVAFGGDGARLERESPALKVLPMPADPAGDAVEAMMEALARSQRRPILLARRAHLDPAQARAIAGAVRHYPDAMVISLQEPFDVALFPDARHLLAAYGDDEASIGGLADVLFGGSPPAGRLPVKLAR